MALLPVAGVFTTSRLFYVRDLAWYFWPRHLWLRQSWAAGDWPWWDPYGGGGQSAAADALNQFFLLPVVFIRLFAPDIVGFNLWIALPFPLAAAGTWLWLRRHVAPAPAFVGAVAFALSGPMLSTGNFPNLSWSAAFIPWVLWAADRMNDRRGLGALAVLSSVFALQALSGEPVTLIATGGLVVAHALVIGPGAGERRARVVRAARVATALFVGLLLAAIQLWPLADAAMRSPRGQRAADNFWSLHPLASIQALLPYFFGEAHRAAPGAFPWIEVLNSYREPLFYSLYVGVGVLVLALTTATREGRAWRRFWWGVAIVFTIFSFGQHTPVYAFIQKVLPVVGSFRYPVKFTLFAALGLAALAAAGADAIRRHVAGEETLRFRAALWFAGLLAVLGLGVASLNTFGFEAMSVRYTEFGRQFSLPDPVEGGLWLAGPATMALARSGTLALLSCILLIALRQRQRTAALTALLLCAVPLVDLLSVNHDLNPTAPREVLNAPTWLNIVRAHPDDSVYVGGLMRSGSIQHPPVPQVDAARETKLPAELAFGEALALVGTQYMMFPATWQVRQIIGYDLTELWPREYRAVLVQFLRRPFADRLRLLARSGVRYCILPQPPHPGTASLHALEPLFHGFDLYECNAEARRAFLVPTAVVETDLNRRIDILFDPAFEPAQQVLLESPPPAASGTPGPSASQPNVEIVSQRNTETVLRASVGPGGGYLTLLDSFDPYWQVSVDGVPGTLLRANVLFRSVRLTPGTHQVRFEYRPMPLYAGTVVSVASVLALALGVVISRRSRRPVRPAVAVQAGFTLIELLIVIGVVAILFATAVPWLLSARMAANEAAAVSVLEAITDAQALYKEVCGKGRYAAALPALGMPMPTTGDVFLSPDLTSGDAVAKSGYEIVMRGEPGETPVKGCNDADTSPGYAVTADPLRLGNSGRRFFATNASGVIYEHGETFGATMTQSGPPAVGTELK
jgi:prepilin-type N-terminal cleavage/methylation domain-containing protein